MKRMIIALGMACLSNLAIAQIQGTWQQEVNYTLRVTLDDQLHLLRGMEEFEYVNHSPQTLDVIYVHLWPNAYKNKHTALAKQLMMGGKDYLFRNDPEYQGYIDSLDFRVGGQPLKLTYDQTHIDIAKLTLLKPLAPGEKVVITTPFRVKLPSGEVSRMGHIGQTYQITQWYPKPAVFDEKGWHPMPYLNQGEFYSEYGRFDVSITLPENYTVGATGNLQTEREIKRLNLLAEYNAPASLQPNAEDKAGMYPFQGNDHKELIPPGMYRASDIPMKRSDIDWSNIEKHYQNIESSRAMKTIRYTQSRVHDFAWFADKSFRVLKGEVVLPRSGKTVTTWAMYTENSADLWKPHAMEYLHDGILKYSRWNGDYPYNQVTAVDGTISAGGGMEYPNVTVIGNASTKEELEVVIVHEVGHNWFYGILGSNERDFGWMDEGLNTLNEMRFVAEKYPENTRLSDMAGGAARKLGFVGLSHKDVGDVLYRCMSSFGVDQPLHNHSADFSSTNYGGVMYQKTGLIFHYLKAYLGDSLFDVCMQTYFDRWKFRHPQPEDFRAVMEAVSKQDLGWLFDDLIETRKVADYKISKVKKTGAGLEVTVKNVGSVDGPVGVQSMRNGKVYESVWVSPDELKKANGLIRLSNWADTVMIDADRNIPEVNRNNNMWTKGGREFKWKFGTGNDLPNERNHYWLPAVGWNQYDRMMLGLVLHNTSLPAPKFRYSLVPMYSFGRKNLSGLGDISYNPLGGNRYKSLRIGVSAMTFQGNTSWLDSLGDNSMMHPGFTVIKPYAIIELGSAKRRKGFTHFLEATGLINWQGRDWAPFYGTERSNVGIYGWRLNYFGTKRGPVSVLEYKSSFESVSQVSDFINSVTGRVQLEAKYTWNYIAEKKKARNIELRGYWGKVGMLSSTRNGGLGAQTENMYLMLSGVSGQQDVFYDEYFRGRNSAPTFGNNSWMGQYDFATNGQQRMDNMGGMGTATFMGSSTSLAAINFSMSLPKVPGFIRVFADYASMPNEVHFTVPEALPLPTQFFDAGLMIRTGFLQVSLPLFMNNDLQKTLGGIEEVGGPGGIKQYVLPTYKQQLQRGIRFSLKIPLNSGLFLRKSLLSSI
ncbi:MAG: M1 family metallopeptidase [Bacteroidetes bacterium]|nr:M1 family metallopeptidase [Bacteroidota bacterium]